MQWLPKKNTNKFELEDAINGSILYINKQWNFSFLFLIRFRLAHSLPTVKRSLFYTDCRVFASPAQIFKKVSGWHQFAWFARNFTGGKIDDWPLHRTLYRAVNYTFWPKSERENLMTLEKNNFITVLKINNLMMSRPLDSDMHLAILS